MEDTEDTLPSWVPHFSSCSECEKGFIIKDGNAYKCVCRKNYEAELRTVFSLYQSNILSVSSSKDVYEFFTTYSLENYKGKDTKENIPKIQKYIKDFNDKFSSFNLFFTGIPGTQKTTLAKYILSQLVTHEGKTGYYILANTLIEYLADALWDENKKKLIKYILNVDFLVIDEMDSEKIILYQTNGGQWQKSHFLPFIKQRLENVKKSTLFVSNRSPDNLGEQFEGAIQDVIERETSSGVFTFEDKYSYYKPKVDLKKIWDDD